MPKIFYLYLFLSQNLIVLSQSYPEELNIDSNYNFIQFYSNSGLIFKKPHIVLGNNFSLHRAKTHLPLATCYQINLKSCKFLLKYFKEKIFQTNDFPAYYINKKIKQF
jgi:hypothetical protein